MSSLISQINQIINPANNAIAANMAFLNNLTANPSALTSAALSPTDAQVLDPSLTSQSLDSSALASLESELLGGSGYSDPYASSYGSTGSVISGDQTAAMQNMMSQMGQMFEMMTDMAGMMQMAQQAGTNFSSLGLSSSQNSLLNSLFPGTGSCTDGNGGSNAGGGWGGYNNQQNQNGSWQGAEGNQGNGSTNTNSNSSSEGQQVATNTLNQIIQDTTTNGSVSTSDLDLLQGNLTAGNYTSQDLAKAFQSQILNGTSAQASSVMQVLGAAQGADLVNLKQLLKPSFLSQLSTTQTASLAQEIGSTGLVLTDGSPNTQLSTYLMNAQGANAPTQVQQFGQQVVQQLAANYLTPTTASTDPNNQQLVALLTLQGFTFNADGTVNTSDEPYSLT